MVNPTPNLKKNRMHMANMRNHNPWKNHTHMANHIPNPKWKKPRSMAKTGIHTNIKGVVAQTSMELLEAWASRSVSQKPHGACNNSHPDLGNNS